jgi:hypothetical protein
MPVRRDLYSYSLVGPILRRLSQLRRLPLLPPTRPWFSRAVAPLPTSPGRLLQHATTGILCSSSSSSTSTARQSRPPPSTRLQTLTAITMPLYSPISVQSAACQPGDRRPRPYILYFLAYCARDIAGIPSTRRWSRSILLTCAAANRPVRAPSRTSASDGANFRVSYSTASTTTLAPCRM